MSENNKKKNTEQCTLHSVRVRLINALQKVVDKNKNGESIFIGYHHNSHDYTMADYDVEELVDAIIEKDNTL